MPALSIVIPFYNESGNVRPLCDEVIAVLNKLDDAEIVLVDDGSADDTFAQLQSAKSAHSGLMTVIRHRQRCGQSTALITGVRAARGATIVTLDGDGQNDPADIPALITAARELAAGDRPYLVIGRRLGRKDNIVRRVSSRIANSVRSALLRDDTPDSGCGLKVFRREDFLELPYFDHMHRFLPALFKRLGGTVLSVDVSHRPRVSGKSKYGIGNRLWAGIVDLIGVAWLLRRSKLPEVEIFR